MNINHLKYFRAVCLFRSVSEAAEYLHISQPSLSVAIKELENKYGVVLFRRHHKGVTLTPEGEVFYKLSEDIVSRAEQAEKLMEDLGNGRKTLRLGVPPMIGSLILSVVYREFLSQNPEILLEITEGGQQELLDQLEKDYLDMAILPHTAPFGQKLAAQAMAKPEIVCCVAKGSPFAGCASVKAEDFDRMPLVMFKDSFFQTRKIKQWFEESGVAPNILLQTEQLSTMLSMIRNRVAAGFVFRTLAENDPDLVLVPTEVPMYVNISLVWKKDSHIFSGMQKFRKYADQHNPFL